MYTTGRSTVWPLDICGNIQELFTLNDAGFVKSPPHMICINVNNFAV